MPPQSIYVQCKKGHDDIWPFMSHIEETAGFVCGGISTELLFCFTLQFCFRVLQSLDKVHAFEISTCLSSVAEHHQVVYRF